MTFLFEATIYSYILHANLFYVHYRFLLYQVMVMIYSYNF